MESDTMSWKIILKEQPISQTFFNAATELQKLDARFRPSKTKIDYVARVKDGEWGAKELMTIVEVGISGIKRQHDRGDIDDLNAEIFTGYYEEVGNQLESWRNLERDNQ